MQLSSCMPCPSYATYRNELAQNAVQILSSRCPRRPVCLFNPQTLALKSARPWTSWVLQTSTSSRIRHLGCPERHSQAISRNRNVDLIEDSTPRMPRTPFSGHFSKSERRPHQGFDTSDAQNAILRPFLKARMSTSSRFRHLGCPERHSQGISESQNVDLIEVSTPRVHRTPFSGRLNAGRGGARPHPLVLPLQDQGCRQQAQGQAAFI